MVKTETKLEFLTSFRRKAAEKFRKERLQLSDEFERKAHDAKVGPYMEVLDALITEQEEKIGVQHSLFT